MRHAYAKLKKDFLALRTLHNAVVDERERLRKRNEELVAQTVHQARVLSEEKSNRAWERAHHEHLSNEFTEKTNKLQQRLDLCQKALYTLIEKMP